MQLNIPSMQVEFSPTPFKTTTKLNVVNLRRNICSENILHIFLLFSIQTIVYIV